MTENKSVLPYVSVIMPAYNAERFIGAAVRSVMNQTFTDWELLVIDDGSSDSTCDIVRALAAEDDRIKLLVNDKNMGVAKTRNRGFDICRGQYVALLDSDDVWYPEKLKKQLEKLDEQGADFAYCSYAIVDADGKKAKSDYVTSEQVDFEKLLRENVIGCSTVVLSRKIVERHRFETDFYHEDYVLWLDLLRCGYKAVGCSETLVDWRLIENSRSFDKRKSAKNRWRIYREHLGLSFVKSVYVFGHYAFASLKKYSG